MSAAVTVVCPRCNNKMRASAEHLGRKGRCPVCKNLIEITAPAAGETLPSGAMSVVGQRTRGLERRASTDVNGWLTGIIGAVATAIFYLIVFGLLRGTPVYRYFYNGGSISACNTLITCWGIAILVLKYIAVKRQVSYAERELQFIPLEIGLQITPSNVDQFLAHLAGLPPAQRLSILGRRIQGALEHFKARNSVPEVQQYLATQAEIDASAVDSGYTLLRSFIWANPILGFIGTVVGIGIAVGGLAAGLSGGQEADMTKALVDSLTTVTNGLATAFDTTLIGLVFAMLLLLPTESLRKVEYAMLDRVEAFANESLLRRMAASDSTADASIEQMPTVVRSALESAFAEHQRWLSQWQVQVSQLGQLVGADFEQAVSKVEQRIAESDADRLGQFQQLAGQFTHSLEQQDRFLNAWERQRGQLVSGSQEVLAAASGVQTALASTAELCRVAVDRQAATIEAYSRGDLAEVVRALRDEVARLAERLDNVPAAVGAPRDGHAQTASYPTPLAPELLPTERADARGIMSIFRRRG